MALCIPAVGESYDCAKAAISLERSNSFPWPEDCVQIHQTPFPSQRVGSGHETTWEPDRNWPAFGSGPDRPFPSLRVGSGNETRNFTATVCNLARYPRNLIRQPIRFRYHGAGHGMT